MIIWSSLGLSLAALLLTGAAPPSTPPDRQPTQAAAFPGAWPGESGGSDRSGKGAVLCAWTMAVGAQQVGAECFPGQDEAFKAELGRSIASMDRFIVQNSSGRITQALLDKKKRIDIAGREYMDGRKAPRGAVCTSDGMGELWQAYRQIGAEQLRASTTDMLSVPREPVMNPCL